jgi:hypothetical protein
MAGGKVYHFDGIDKNGVDEAIIIPHSPKMNFDYTHRNCALALTCWIKMPKNPKKTYRIIDRGQRSKHRGYYLGIKNHGSVYCKWRGIPYTTLVSKSKVNDGKWHHIGLVLQGHTLKLYLDGKIEKEVTKKSITKKVHINCPFIIGQDQYHKNLFVGSIKDVRLYQWIPGHPNNTITDADINAIKNDKSDSYAIANSVRILKKEEAKPAKKMAKIIVDGSMRGMAGQDITAEELPSQDNPIKWIDLHQKTRPLILQKDESLLIIQFKLKPNYSLSKYDYSFQGKSQRYPCLSVSSTTNFGDKLQEVIAKDQEVTVMVNSFSTSTPP